MDFISFCLDLKDESYRILKFLRIQKIRKLFYFYFGCGNGTRHTSSRIKLSWTIIQIIVTNLGWLLLLSSKAIAFT